MGFGFGLESLLFLCSTCEIPLKINTTWCTRTQFHQIYKNKAIRAWSWTSLRRSILTEPYVMLLVLVMWTSNLWHILENKCLKICGKLGLEGELDMILVASMFFLIFFFFFVFNTTHTFCMENGGVLLSSDPTISPWGKRFNVQWVASKMGT